jgi:hypothetical protein
MYPSVHLAVVLHKEKDKMACEFICDGCRERKSGFYNSIGWFKPALWFERSDKDGVQTVCSRECIKIVAEKTGKTNLVVPI